MPQNDSFPRALIFCHSHKLPFRRSGHVSDAEGRILGCTWSSVNPFGLISRSEPNRQNHPLARASAENSSLAHLSQRTRNSGVPFGIGKQMHHNWPAFFPDTENAPCAGRRRILHSALVRCLSPTWIQVQGSRSMSPSASTSCSGRTQSPSCTSRENKPDTNLDEPCKLREPGFRFVTRGPTIRIWPIP